LPALFSLPRQTILDEDGNPIVGALVYFYQTGSTTPQAVYADVSLETPLTNPLVSDASGRLPKFYLNPAASANYRVNITTADGVQIYQEDDVSRFTASQDEIGAAFYPTSERESALGISPISYAYNIGDVRRYGALGDDTADDTAAFDLAVMAVGADGGTVTAIAGARHYIGNPRGIIVTRNVKIDLQGAVLRGMGNSSTSNTLINSGRINDSALQVNTLSEPVVGAQVCNGTLYRAAYGMQLRYCIDSCNFENLQILECYNGIDANFCLYADFENIMYRNAGAGTAYRFSNNCNAITLKMLYATGNNPATLANGFKFEDTNYAIKMVSCSTEFCVTGISTEEMHNFDIDGHYFEVVTTGVDLGGSAAGRKIGVRMANCFFSDVDHLVVGKTVNNFVWEASNERFSNCVPGDIDLSNEVSITTGALAVCTGVIHLSETSMHTVGPTSALKPSWLILSDGIDLKANAVATRDGGFATPILAKAALTTGAANGIIPLHYSGYGGYVPNAVAFCANSSSGGTTFDVRVDTGISYSDYGFVIFRIKLTDNINSYTMDGRVIGTTVYMDNVTTKTVTASNNSGNLRLNFSSFSHPSGTYSIEGIVRHV
jgi:hypothetical protein